MSQSIDKDSETGSVTAVVSFISFHVHQSVNVSHLVG